MTQRRWVAKAKSRIVDQRLSHCNCTMKIVTCSFSDPVEFATLELVDWFSNRRLLTTIGNIPPGEYAKAYYRIQEEQAKVA